MMQRCLLCNLWCYDTIKIRERIWDGNKEYVDRMTVKGDIVLPSGNMIHPACMEDDRMYVGWQNYKIDTYLRRKKRRHQMRLEDYLC